MKTKNLLMASAAALAALLLLPGCQRETINPEETQDGVKTESIPLWFEGVNMPGTRVEVDGTTGDGIWTEGDRIAIYVAGSGAGFYQIKAVENIDPDNQNIGHSMVSMAAGQQRSNFAIYPYTAAVADHVTQGDLYINYPAEYDYSRIPAAKLDTYTPAPMVAFNNATDPTDPLYFYHVGGVFRVTVKNVLASTKYLRFTFPATMKFSGTYAVNIPTTGTDAEKMRASTLSPVGTDHGHVITVKLPVDIPGGDLTLNIPLPYGDYDATDRTYTVTAISGTNLDFMEVNDYVNWKGLARAQGKKSSTFELETLGMMGGYYLTRGPLKDANTILENPLLNMNYQRTWAFVELGKFMTNNPDYDGTVSFADAVRNINGVDYRVPTVGDWNRILVYGRPGSIVNGVSNTRYTFVNVDLSGSDFTGSLPGLIVFPDGGKYTIEGLPENYHNISGVPSSPFTISYSVYRSLCEGTKNCVFIPTNIGTEPQLNAVRLWTPAPDASDQSAATVLTFTNYGIRGEKRRKTYVHQIYLIRDN